MSELSTPQADAIRRQWMLTQLLLHALADAFDLSKRAGLWSRRMLRTGASHVRTAASRAFAAIAALRLPVRHSVHARVTRQLERFEVQAVASVRGIECREKRTRALLALARTAYEIGRDNKAFLVATLDELHMEHYWQRKQQRTFSAAQLACSTAGLAAMSGHADIGRDAYLRGQGYNGKVTGVDRKIGMAIAFADVAALLEACYDRVAWLATAMELACGITENAERIGAVNHVARKMVIDRIPPCDDRAVDKRFAVDMAAMAPVRAEKAASSGSDYDEFNLVM